MGNVWGAGNTRECLSRERGDGEGEKGERGDGGGEKEGASLEAVIPSLPFPDSTVPGKVLTMVLHVCWLFVRSGLHSLHLRTSHIHSSTPDTLNINFSR